MPEIDRFDGPSDWIDVEFVEREATPSDAMELGIQLHVAVNGQSTIPQREIKVLRNVR